MACGFFPKTHTQNFLTEMYDICIKSPYPYGQNNCTTKSGVSQAHT